jgi:serine/threonine protein kinase
MSIKYKFIGKGAFGFVVSPNLSNSIEDIIFNSVSKIFIDDDEADIEVENHRIMDMIDPEHQYHIKMLPDTNHNIILRRELLNLNMPSEITKRIPARVHYFYATYQFGGLNLIDLFKNSPGTNEKHYKKEIYVQLCSQFFKIFGAVLSLQENGYMHHDLKHNNILVDNNMTLKIIDFGLMENLREYYQYCICTDNKNPMPVYEFFPFEIEFYNVKNYENHITISSKCNYLPKLEYLRTHYNLFFKIYEKNDTQPSFQETYDMMIASMATTSHKDFLKSSFYTFDIYTLGITLVFITEQYAEIFIKNQYASEHTHCSATFDHRYPEWLHFDALYAIVCRMITPNVFERIKIDELLIQFRQYIELISTPTNV